MDPEKLSGIIQALPMLVIYIVPGYIFLWVKGFILSEKTDKASEIVLKSIVVSYMLIILEKYFFMLFGKTIDITQSTQHKVALMVIAIISGYFWPKIILSSRCDKLLRSIGVNKTFNPWIWDDMVDLEFGLWANVYLPSERMIYRGQIRKYEEREEFENYLLILSNYTTYTYDGKVIANYEKIDENWVAIFTKDVSRIELFYHPNSKKIITK